MTERSRFDPDYSEFPLFDTDKNMAPFQLDSETSAAAAEQIVPKLGELQAKVLEFVCGRGDGVTDEEISLALRMNPSTARPRRVELEKKVLIEKSGNKRATRSGRSAVVWTATRKAMNWFKEKQSVSYEPEKR